MAKAPVIIIGMHRSGTSMLTKFLQQLGLFIGEELLPFDLHEASYFVALNEWLLQQTNASWDNPYNHRFMDEFIERECIEVVEDELKGKNRKKFLGRKLTGNYKNIKNLNIPWGWKDPRTTINLNVWMKIFPNAKLVHIYRNPIDVAQSLRKREYEIREHTKLNYAMRVMKFLNYKATKSLSARVMHLPEGVKLWESYVSRALQIDEQYGKSQCFHLRYEDFLEEPAKHFRELLNFIELSPPETDIQKLIADVRSDRKFAFLKNEELMEQYQKIKDNPLVQRLGYGELG